MNGSEMDTYADDLAIVDEALDLRNAIHVGHSTGGEVGFDTSEGTAPSVWPRPC